MKVQIKNDKGELILDVTAIPESNSLETQLALEKDADGGLLFRARQLGVIDRFFTTCKATYVIAASRDITLL